MTEAVIAAKLADDAVEGLAADAAPGANPAAVLVVLRDGERGAEVLLTKRSRHLRRHSGEISFPGGRLDENETPHQAALREAFEEVGLDPSVVEITSTLTPLVTFVDRSYVVPLLARLTADPLTLQAAADEVERILWVPICDLARADTYRAEAWELRPVEYPIHFFELDDETIWGATGRMLFELVDVVYGPPAMRTAL